VPDSIPRWGFELQTIAPASPCRHRSYSPKRECQLFQLFGRSHQKGPPRISDIANKSVRDSPWWNPHKISPMEPTRIRHPYFPRPRSPIECSVIGHARAGPAEPQQQLRVEETIHRFQGPVSEGQGLFLMGRSASGCTSRPCGSTCLLESGAGRNNRARPAAPRVHPRCV
jgi:hypothetical protein